MTMYKVVDEFDELMNIKLHDKEILPSDLKEDGKWPACFSPMNNPSYEPHYSVSVHKHSDDEEVSALYMAQFFVEDGEFDSFIVEVHGGRLCETHMHLHHHSILDSDMLLTITHTVEEIQNALPQIAKQHDKSLGIKELV